MKKISFFTLFALVFGIAFALPVHSEETECPTLSAGDTFKVTGHSAVYLLDDNLKRLYFPNSEVFHSWYDNFSNVTEISETCVDNYPAPLDPPFGVNFRPGSRLVKVKISPTVYVIEPGNKLRKIGSEKVARELYGANWSKLVRDVADAFWPNFKKRGLEIKEAKPHDGMFLRTPGDDGVYYVENKELKKVEDPSTVDKEDIRVVGRGVFAKLAVRSGLIESKRAFLRPHQKDKDDSDDDSDDSDDDSNDNDDSDNSDDTADTIAPVISELSTSVSSTTATITWKTDKNAESEVNYGTTTTTYDFSIDATTIEKDDGTFTHTAQLTGLETGTYYFQAESKDTSDNKSEKEGEFSIE